MTYARLCKHEQLHSHEWKVGGDWPNAELISKDCPGGEFLPEGTLVIEKDADGEWPDWAYEVAGRRLEFVGGTDQWKHASYRMAYLSLVFRALESHFALASQVGESE